jgi:DNA-binding helix-hairpin-helix protein with protein kinase domain
MKENPRRRHGAQSGDLVECWRKPKTHGFHPAYEECPYCDVPREYFYSSGPASPGDEDITLDFGWPTVQLKIEAGPAPTVPNTFRAFGLRRPDGTVRVFRLDLVTGEWTPDH